MRKGLEAKKIVCVQFLMVVLQLLHLFLYISTLATLLFILFLQ